MNYDDLERRKSRRPTFTLKEGVSAKKGLEKVEVSQVEDEGVFSKRRKNEEEANVVLSDLQLRKKALRKKRSTELERDLVSGEIGKRMKLKQERISLGDDVGARNVLKKNKKSLKFAFSKSKSRAKGSAYSRESKRSSRLPTNSIRISRFTTNDEDSKKRQTKNKSKGLTNSIVIGNKPSKFKALLSKTVTSNQSKFSKIKIPINKKYKKD
jgi:hypothetical protein